jgi:hypothetical protein
MSDQALVLLPQGAGYGATIGLGLVFGIGMILVSRFLSKYMNERSDHSEMFVILLYSKPSFVTLTTNDQVHGRESFCWDRLDGICCDFILDVGVSIRVICCGSNANYGAALLSSGLQPKVIFMESRVNTLLVYCIIFLAH